VITDERLKERELLDMTMVRLLAAIGTKRVTVDLAKDAVQRLSALDRELLSLRAKHDKIMEALREAGPHLDHAADRCNQCATECKRLAEESTTVWMRPQFVEAGKADEKARDQLRALSKLGEE
jgi:hypothetical protein